MDLLYPLTSTMYGLSGILLLIATAALFRSYLQSHILQLKHLSGLFFCFALFLLALSAPAYLAPTNSTVIAYGFIVGVVFVYGILFFAIRVGRDVDIHLFRKLAHFSNIGVGLTGILTLFFLFYDFQLPILTEKGIILWNISPSAAIPLCLASLYAGSMWSYIFFKAGRIVWRSDRIASIKFFIFANNGITSGVAGTLVFVATTPWVSLVGLGLMAFACLITMIIFVLPSHASIARA